MKGRLATGFADLVTRMWSDTNTALSPSELKELIAEKRPEFAGYQQHDAQEVLTFLLDGLHEDVNRAPYPRPIVEDPSSEGRSDAEVAAEAWTGNLRRNCSRIVDIFQFQVRSEITFPEVNGKSLKFDPMMYLSLPVPSPPHVLQVTVLLRRYPEAAPARRSFAIPKVSTFRDLEAQILEAFPPEPERAGGRCFAFANLYDKRVLRLFGRGQAVGEVRSYDTVWAFEVPLDEGEPDDHEFGYASVQRKTATQCTSSTCFTMFAPPLIFAFLPGKTTNEEVSERVLAHAERLKGFLRVGGLEAALATAQEPGEEGTSLGTEGEFQAEGRSLMLNFQGPEGWEGTALPEPEEASTTEAEAERPKGDLEVSLEDCLDAFTRLEELAQEDWVRCERTGRFERSRKKLDLWTAPDCLLVHLKRFGSEQLSGPLEKALPSESLFSHTPDLKPTISPLPPPPSPSLLRTVQSLSVAAHRFSNSNGLSHSALERERERESLHRASFAGLGEP